jgi:hypothetical protein
LGLASGGEVADIEPVVRSRLRRALSLEGLGALAPRLERRAAMSRYSAHRGEIAHVLADDRLVATGISAVGAVGLDLVSGGEVDGYIRASVSDDFVEEHALSRAGEGEENVTLRVVPDEAWADFLDGEPYAPKAAVALDLVEDADPRSRAAGRDLIRRLDRAAR